MTLPEVVPLCAMAPSLGGNRLWNSCLQLYGCNFRVGQYKKLRGLIRERNFAGIRLALFIGTSNELSSTERSRGVFHSRTISPRCTRWGAGSSDMCVPEGPFIGCCQRMNVKLVTVHPQPTDLHPSRLPSRYYATA